MYERICAWCGAAFVGGPRRKHCSPRCRRAPWRSAHHDQELAYWRERYWNNRAAEAERKRAWYQVNSDRARELTRAWSEANRDRKNAAQGRRRARRANWMASASADEWLRVLERHGRRCYYCRAEGDLTIDHKIPLARGGSHTIDNLVPACRSCNLRKGTKDELEFAALLALERLVKDRSLKEDAAPYEFVPDQVAAGV